jgi:threonine dehydratase
VHPYDDEAIIAGQGTVALEMLEAVPELDTLVVAVGGGGLIAGMAVAAQGAEARLPKSSACRRCAFRQHVQRGQAHAPAAGQEHHRRGHRGRHAGQVLTQEIIASKVDDLVLVDEGDIEQAS